MEEAKKGECPRTGHKDRNVPVPEPLREQRELLKLLDPKLEGCKTGGPLSKT